MIDSSTNLYALIGNPVSGSKSPWIHNHIFETCHLPGAYLAFDIEKDQLSQAVVGMKALNVKGINVTIPYKTEIMTFLDEVDPLAEKLGAVNTIVCKDGKWKGFNTDGLGLIAVLKRHIADFEEKKVLVLGAGGAARGICGILAESKIAEMGIWNRTPERAIQLSEALNLSKSENGHFDITPVSSVKAFINYDVVINTTSVGMAPDIEQTPVEITSLNPDAIVCDIVYKPHKTKLISEALSNGHNVIYGIEMLLEQALLAQKLWNGLTDEVISKNRNELMTEFEALNK